MILLKICCATLVVIGLAGAGLCQSTFAQSAASSQMPAAAAGKKPRPLKTLVLTSGKTSEKAKPPALEPWAAVDPGRVAPTPPPEPASAPLSHKDRKAAATDDAQPLNRPDLAMKWNGTNDSPTQTRVQNYGGEAEGAGAAMGLKFHF